MVVNLLGNPNDFDELKNIIDGREIVMVEDNCKSMGATFNGREAGTLGVAGSFLVFFTPYLDDGRRSLCDR